MTLRRRIGRRFERALIGTVMNAIAFITERRVLKAIRGAGGRPRQPREFESGLAGKGPARRA